MTISEDKASSVFDLTPYDTSIAWLELTLLCQCNGPLQQGKLTVFVPNVTLCMLSAVSHPL